MWSVAAAFLGYNGGGAPADVARLRRDRHGAPASYAAIARNFFVVNAEEKASAGETAPRVLVGGGSGFVGQELVRLLRRKGYEVLIVSRTADPGPGGFMERAGRLGKIGLFSFCQIVRASLLTPG